MSTFAVVENTIVINVVIADASLENTWVEATEATKTPFIGGTYDVAHNLFLPVQPYPSWTFNYTDYKWEAPVPYPDPAVKYVWNESTLSWDKY